MKSNYSTQIDTTLALRRQLRPAGINGRLARPNSTLLSFPFSRLNSTPTFLWDPIRLDRLKMPLSHFRE